MKNVFYLVVIALISVVTVSCGNNRGESAKGNAYADSVLQSIRKYDQISLLNGETSVDVYVKEGELVDDVYDSDDGFFWISFIDKSSPEYKGKRFLDQPNSKLTEKGKLINKPVRHYIVHIGDEEDVLSVHEKYVKTTKRIINIHYIYE